MTQMHDNRIVSPKKLNLGCGRKARSGYLNLDGVALEGVDVVHDLNSLPYPFADGSFEEVYAKSVLEHLDDLVGAVREIHRILEPGGRAELSVPHFSHRGAYGDPTHKHFFAFDTLLYFVRGHQNNYEVEFSFSEGGSRLVFAKGWQIWNHLVQPAANLRPSIYELTALRSLFPAHRVETTLIK